MLLSIMLRSLRKNSFYLKKREATTASDPTIRLSVLQEFLTQLQTSAVNDIPPLVERLLNSGDSTTSTLPPRLILRPPSTQGADDTVIKKEFEQFLIYFKTFILIYIYPYLVLFIYNFSLQIIICLCNMGYFLANKLSTYIL
uniref:Uncharacterized protein n=1 Tax=Strongyloides papillosus TaxID=174720 RepID=A0A0N5BS42_STREA